MTNLGGTEKPERISHTCHRLSAHAKVTLARPEESRLGTHYIFPCSNRASDSKSACCGYKYNSIIMCIALYLHRIGTVAIEPVSLVAGFMAAVGWNTYQGDWSHWGALWHTSFSNSAADGLGRYSAQRRPFICFGCRAMRPPGLCYTI